jgi:hypothetical protein
MKQFKAEMIDDMLDSDLSLALLGLWLFSFHVQSFQGERQMKKAK